MGASQNLNITVSTQVSLTDIADLTKIQPISKSVDTAQHKNASNRF
ncbi:hypothetical protein P4S63_22710 [Pseudoalteromonas sp. B193]